MSLGELSRDRQLLADLKHDIYITLATSFSPANVPQSGCVSTRSIRSVCKPLAVDWPPTNLRPTSSAQS